MYGMKGLKFLFAFLILAFLCLFAFFITVTSAAININVTGFKGSYTPNEQLVGNVEVKYDEFVPKQSFLMILINTNLIWIEDLQDQLHDESYYINHNYFKRFDFNYNITGTGDMVWEEYPDQEFTSSIQVIGYYYNRSRWGPFDFDLDTKRVNKTEGMKFIYNALATFNIPHDVNESTVYWAISNTNSNVQTTMREACGNEPYETHGIVGSDGWLRRELRVGTWSTSGVTGRNATIEFFDDGSLAEYRNLYGGGPGGIYRDDIYLQYGDDVIWDGETGYIEIFEYNSGSTYTITYLPPNGGRACAITNYDEKTQNWESVSDTKYGSVSYANPFTAVHTSLPLPPSCPPPTALPGSNCTTPQANLNYYATFSGPDTIDFNYQYNLLNLTVTATTDSMDLSRNHSVYADLSDIPDLRAPAPGNHTMILTLVDSSNIQLASNFFAFSTCADADDDGFCAEIDDCDDNNHFIYPGANETCDGIDNDCDDEIDEDFWGIGRLGEECGIGACAGKMVCTLNGSGIKCSNDLKPGALPEICNDSIDNDCDGITDEHGEEVDGVIEDCVCKNGTTQECGSPVGECEPGEETCVSNEWGDCEGSVGPTTEICNQLDDNCDGITDNVGAPFGERTTVSRSHCQCYDGRMPTSEVCNNIDDDCNELIDDGLLCCSHGDTRSCSEGGYYGACADGTQTCWNGVWGDCSIQATTELCNDIDDDCDGQADNDCIVDKCENSLWDEDEDGIDCGGVCPNDCPVLDFSSILIIVGMAVLVALILLYFYFKRKGKSINELTWEDLKEEWG